MILRGLGRLASSSMRESLLNGELDPISGSNHTSRTNQQSITHNGHQWMHKVVAA